MCKLRKPKNIQLNCNKSVRVLVWDLFAPNPWSGEGGQQGDRQRAELGADLEAVPGIAHWK